MKWFPPGPWIGSQFGHDVVPTWAIKWFPHGPWNGSHMGHETISTRAIKSEMSPKWYGPCHKGPVDTAPDILIWPICNPQGHLCNPQAVLTNWFLHFCLSLCKHCIYIDWGTWNKCCTELYRRDFRNLILAGPRHDLTQMTSSSQQSRLWFGWHIVPHDRITVQYSL